MNLELRPISQAEAFEYIKLLHRHHNAPVGALWWHAVQCQEGVLRGVAIVGRPVARKLDDGLTSEVTRVCTDGAPNACSMLYGAARRVSIDKGYRRGLTYILEDEDGASLRAAGYSLLWQTDGGSWDRPGRPRSDKHPTCRKWAYGWGAWAQLTQAAAASKEAA